MTELDLKQLCDQLINTPRKCLSWRTRDTEATSARFVAERMPTHGGMSREGLRLWSEPD